MEEPQKSLERYDILDRIATGGMAEVFLAKAYGAHGFEKTIAIKRILPELARDPEFEARFIAEAKVAVKLSHANVVQVLDFGRIGESLFIAMEYVDGLDLAALIRRYRDDKLLVPLPAAFHIAIEIVRALDFAHGHGVVHRDVSPSNILISRAGEVKIGDFGIAIAAQPHRAGGPGPRKVMGKWRYMSPEQARGDTLDTRSDLFSAASVMFELFTGEKLFPGDESEDIIANIQSMVIPKAASLRPGLPSRLDEILAGPLQRKPIDRPGRPAIVLRSLIELSYESSIMATAMDVAECVATILPAKRAEGPGAQLDDVIRKQLGEKKDKSVARKTAVTDNRPASTQTLEREDAFQRSIDARAGEHANGAGATERRGEVSTGLFRKVDVDGLSRLEEVEIAEGDPTAARNAGASDSGLHKLLDAHFDPDRRTEVGGPPTGQVPKSEPESAKRGKDAKRTGGARRGIAVAAAIVLVGGAGIAWWAITRDRGGAIARADAAAVPAARAQIEIDPDPEGASGTITDASGAVLRRFQATTHAAPPRVDVAPDTRVHVHIEHAGFLPVDEDVTVRANMIERLRPGMKPARASLHVVTKPVGAKVLLAGKLLGDTPLVRDDLVPGSGEDLSIELAGYEPQKLSVDLVVGKTTEIERELKAVEKFGWVQIDNKPHPYAPIAVTFKGKLLGSARELGTSHPTSFRLPVGRQTLVLENTGSHRKEAIVVDVREGATRSVTTDL
jgi:serine/threonine protein kinase